MLAKKTLEEINAASGARKYGATSFYNNPRYRAVIYQVLLFLLLGYLFYLIVNNTMINMERLGAKTGFNFLSASAGYDILFSVIPFNATDTYGRVFIVGFINTILVSVISIFFATLLGFIFGVAYFSSNWLIKKIAIVYVETFRNIPLLLQVFFWYSAVLAALPNPRQSISLGEAIFLNVRGLYLPKFIGEEGIWLFYAAILVAIAAVFFMRFWAKKRQEKSGEQFPVFYAGIAIFLGLPLAALILTGFPYSLEYPQLRGFNFSGGVTVIPELIALSLALSIYTGAFIAEAVRAGIQAVPHGQTEAARSIGLKESRIMSLIVVPQAMRVIVPLLNSEYQSLVKNSTLAAAIGYPDLFNVFVGTALNQTGQAIETIFMAIFAYFIFNMLISFIMNRFNSSVSLVSR